MDALLEQPWSEHAPSRISCVVGLIGLSGEYGVCVYVLARVSFSSVYVCFFWSALCSVFCPPPSECIFDVLAHLSAHVRFSLVYYLPQSRAPCTHLLSRAGRDSRRILHGHMWWLLDLHKRRPALLHLLKLLFDVVSLR